MLNPTWAYAGGVYAIAIATARRAGVDIPRRVALFFYALVLAFMFEPLTGNAVNVPVDFLQTLPPWSYSVPRPDPANSQMNDIPLQIVPWAHQVRESWKSGQPPLWNAASAAGYPLLANAQSSALSPLRILGLPLSLGHAMTFEAAMKILIALMFMFLWCRRRGHSQLASVTGAVAFGFSSFLLVWLHFPIASTACLVPATFYLIDLLLERVTYRRFVAFAIVWTAMLYGGHPETVSHTFFMITLYVAWVLLVERAAPWPQARRFLAGLIGAMAVSGLLAAPLLAPFAEAVTKSKRFHELQEITDKGDVPWSDWPSAKLLLQPRFYGELPHEASWGPSHAESISGFAGYLGIIAWFAALAHVLRTRAWRSRETFFLLSAVFVLGIILSWPGPREVFEVVFHLAANARLRLFLVLILAVLSAGAVDLLARDRTSVLIGVGAASLVLGYILFVNTYAEDHHRHVAMSTAIPSAVILLVATVAVLVPKKHFAILALLVAVTAELWEVTRDWNPVVSSDWMYPKTPLLEALDEMSSKLPEGEPFRVTANGPAFFPNVAAVYGYEDIRQHDPMVNGRYVGLLRLITDYDASNYFAEWNEFEKRFIDYLNVRYVITTRGGELPPRFRLVYDGHDGRIFENTEVLPRFYPVRNVILEFRDDHFYRELRQTNAWADTAFLDELKIEAEEQREDFFKPRPPEAPLATAAIVKASPMEYRLHVKAPRYSLIVSSIPWWPGWKVERNGAIVEPIRVNGGFLGFAVPEGELDVRVWYDPWTFRFGAIVALATVVALVGFGVRRRSRLFQSGGSATAVQNLSNTGAV